MQINRINISPSRILGFSCWLSLFLLTLSSSNSELVLYYDFEKGNGTVINNHGTSGVPGNFIGGEKRGSWNVGRPGYGTAIELQGGDVNAFWSSSGCGEYGSCSVFDGLPADVRFVDTETSLDHLNVSDDATFMAWIRWDGHVLIPHYADLFGVSSRTGGRNSRQSWPLGSHNFRLMINALDGKMTFHAVDTNNALKVSQVDSQPQFQPEIGEWIHVAYQLEKGQIQIFVNGEPLFAEAQEFKRSMHSGNLQVGFWAWGTFNGAIDEVKIFDSALSQEEIIEEMAPPESPDPGLEVIRVLDLGQVPYSHTATGTLRIANTGSSRQLFIESAEFRDSPSFRVESYPEKLSPGKLGEIRIRVAPSALAGQRHGTLVLKSNDAEEQIATIDVRVSVDNQSSLVTHLLFEEVSNSRLKRNAAPLGKSAVAAGDIRFGQPGIQQATGSSAYFADGVLKVTDSVGSEISMTMWVAPKQNKTGIQTICGAGGVQEPAWALTLVDGNLAWFGGDRSADEPDYLASDSIANSSEPFHLAISIERGRDKTNVKWLVNGSVQPELNLSDSPASIGNLLHIGAYGEGVLPFEGYLDDVQVYDRRLSIEDLQLLFSNPGETLATLGNPDSDGDKLEDSMEIQNSTLLLDPDTDGDELQDGQEVDLGSNPRLRDTDGAGTWDGIEIRNGTDPTNPADDQPVWNISAVALRTPVALADIPIDASINGLDVYKQVSLQRRSIDFLNSDHSGGVIPGGEDLNKTELEIRIQQILFIEGNITIQKGGLRTIGVSSGANFRLIVDGNVVASQLERDRNGATETVALTLTPGVHHVELHAQRSSYLELFHWQSNGDYSENPPFDQALLLQTENVFNVDTDGDNLPDFWELTYFDHLDFDRDDDPDGDGLSIGVEFGLLTNPLNQDTDGDSLEDGVEFSLKTDPRRTDTDGDGLSDGNEVTVIGTDPLIEDSDGDGLRDGFELKRQLDPMSDTDDSIGYLALHYEFETGQGFEIKNLAGALSADLYSSNLENTWGRATDYGRGTGYLLFDAVDFGSDPLNSRFIEDGRWIVGAFDASERHDGSTVFGTRYSPAEIGLTENGYTVMAWVRLDQIQPGFGGLTHTRLLSQIGEETLHSGSFALGITSEGELFTHHGVVVQSSKQISTGNWHHLAWIYDQGELSFVIDGQLAGANLNYPQLPNGTSELVFGSISSSAQSFKGALDGVRIYRSPLTVDKIRSIAGVSDSRRDWLFIASVNSAAEGIEITWPHVRKDATTYDVQFAPDLQANWKTIASVEVNQNSTGSYIDNTKRNAGYYRIRQNGAP